MLTQSCFMLQVLALQRLHLDCFWLVFFKKHKTKPPSKVYNLHGVMCFDLSSAVASPVAIRTWRDSHYKKSKQNAAFITKVIKVTQIIKPLLMVVTHQKQHMIGKKWL